MYRVIVKTAGKYNNVVLGARYCFTKKSAARLMALFHISECDYEIEKLVRLNDDIFFWSKAEVSEKVWEKMWEIVEKNLDNDEV